MVYNIQDAKYCAASSGVDHIGSAARAPRMATVCVKCEIALAISAGEAHAEGRGMKNFTAEGSTPWWIFLVREVRGKNKGVMK